MERHDDMVDAVGYGVASRGHTVKKYYDWKAILGTIVTSVVLIFTYKVVSPNTQSLLFGMVTGVATALWFRPLTKRWKYRMLLKDEKPWTAQYMDEPSTLHNRRIDGQ